MNAAALPADTAEHATTGPSAGGPAPKRIVVAYGFWIFLISDIIIFASLFASYAVLAAAILKAREISPNRSKLLPSIFIGSLNPTPSVVAAYAQGAPVAARHGVRVAGARWTQALQAALHSALVLAIS